MDGRPGMGPFRRKGSKKGAPSSLARWGPRLTHKSSRVYKSFGVCKVASGVCRATAPTRTPTRRNAHLPSVWFAAMSTFTLALLLLASAFTASAVPGTAGSVTSSACGSGSSCSANSSSYVVRSLTYAASTGIFTGTLTTNGATVHHTQLPQ